MEGTDSLKVRLFTFREKKGERHRGGNGSGREGGTGNDKEQGHIRGVTEWQENKRRLYNQETMTLSKKSNKGAGKGKSPGGLKVEAHPGWHMGCTVKVGRNIQSN